LNISLPNGPTPLPETLLKIKLKIKISCSTVMVALWEGGKRENKIKIIFFYYIFNYDKITAVPVSMVPILTLYTLGGSSKGTRQRE